MNKTIAFITVIWAFCVIFLVPGLAAKTRGGFSSENVSFVMQLLGEGKSIVSNLALIQADTYYHGGIGHEHEHFTVGSPQEDGHHHPDGNEDAGGRPDAGVFNVLFSLYDDTRITEHIHLYGDQEKEITPWLYYSIKADPHNVLAITLAAYCLAERLDRVQEALAVLEQGRRDNPDSWEIYAELGKLYFTRLEDPAKAGLYLSRAKVLLAETPHDKFQARYVLTLLGACYEKEQNYPAALKQYQALQEFFPGNGNIAGKISRLSGIIGGSESQSDTRAGRQRLTP